MYGEKTLTNPVRATLTNPRNFMTKALQIRISPHDLHQFSDLANYFPLLYPDFFLNKEF
jgi:hypothetical protein